MLRPTMSRVACCAVLITALAPLAACGDNENTATDEALEARYGGRCAMPRSGVDPTTNMPFIDTAGSVLDEELWLAAWTDDLYLWYREVPKSDPKNFATVLDYFDALKTPAITTSGKPKDQFHFTYVTSDWIALSQSGSVASYGAEWALLSTSPPRKLVVAFTQPGSPAEAAGLKRGTEVLAIDGVDLIAGSDVDTLNNGISPANLHETHSFVVRDGAAGPTRTVSLTSASIEITPVQLTQVLTLPASTDKVGYLLFTDHIATAEKGLFDAITTLSQEGITDLVLDIRYNGGGYLDIASELAFMIAGPSRTTGKVFERESFNDKHQTLDPFSDMPLLPTGFAAQTIGFSAQRGIALPHLDLPRVFVLTGSGTCSASEAVMNGLAGVGVQVIQIGTTTCGKPYGFFPQDNCGTTYFAIQFQGVNDKEFGDYADGFIPGGVNPGCVVADDFGHALADPAEGRLAAALAYRTTGSCPAGAAAASGRDARALADPRRISQAVSAKPLWRENRILTHR
jgi:carboxyl-terminal processing protease